MRENTPGAAVEVPGAGAAWVAGTFEGVTAVEFVATGAGSSARAPRANAATPAVRARQIIQNIISRLMFHLEPGLSLPQESPWFKARVDLYDVDAGEGPSIFFP